MINIIGCGTVGNAILQDLTKAGISRTDLRVVDIDFEKLKKYETEGYNVSITPLIADVHIISVYTVQQVKEVLRKIPLNNKPLISLESTLDLSILPILEKLKEKAHIVIFPHRFNPNDPEHRVFNLNRLMAGMTNESLEVGRNFYLEFMKKENIFYVEPNIAILAKIMENSYRFIEIAVAEEWALKCKEKGIPFNILREAINTKWNIDMKEARDGIHSVCLEKDIILLKNTFKNSKIIDTAIKVDKEYKKEVIK